MSYLPRPPTLGIYQTTIGIVSWDFHPDMVLMSPPSLRTRRKFASAVTGRKYHYTPTQVIAHSLPREFRELLFIARLWIGFRNKCESWLIRLSAVLVRFVIQGMSWRSVPFAFNHFGLRKGKYLKYCYSIFKELTRTFLPLPVI